MELVQKNIHFNRLAKEVRNQITLEEDVNIPDTKEDIEEILFTRHNVLLEEVKTGEQKVHIMGKMQFFILYRSEETGQLCSLTGSVPIEEQLYMEEIHNSDKVAVKTKVEDFSVGMINSRKISVQSILELYAYVQDMYDEQITIGVNDLDCEILQKECDFSQLIVCKKDVLRLRENITIPNNMPNVEELIFSSVKVCEIEYKPLDGQLSVQGKIAVFLLYDGERESRGQMYQTIIPFTTTLECSGSKPNMIFQICYEVIDSQVHLETDFDGEARSFSVELVLELDMKMYEPQKVNVLWDIYGIQKEMIPVNREIHYSLLSGQYCGKIKVMDRVPVEMEEDTRMKVVYWEGDALLESCEMTKEGVVIKGILACQVLYACEGEMNEFGCHRFMIPFMKKMEDIRYIEAAGCSACVHCNDLQISFDMGGNLEVSANVAYNLLVSEQTSGKNIVNIEVKERATDKDDNLPSMAVCFLTGRETLWELGKKYCVPIKQIKEMNQLSSDEIKEGEKILIVRG